MMIRTGVITVPADVCTIAHVEYDALAFACVAPRTVLAVRGIGSNAVSCERLGHTGAPLSWHNEVKVGKVVRPTSDSGFVWERRLHARCERAAPEAARPRSLRPSVPRPGSGSKAPQAQPNSCKHMRTM